MEELSLINALGFPGPLCNTNYEGFRVTSCFFILIIKFRKCDDRFFRPMCVIDIPECVLCGAIDFPS